MGDRRLGALVVAAGAGYLLGTVPSADIAARLAAGRPIDLRTAGSHNPGALNAIDVLGPAWGYAVGLADIAKGAAATGLGRVIAGDLGGHMGGSAAVVGHCYPVWSGFRGGKGVATAIGQLLVGFPAAAPIVATAGAVGALGPFEHRSRAVTALIMTAWVGSGLVWWRRGGPNAWGSDPDRSLAVAAAASSAVVLHRFADDQHWR